MHALRKPYAGSMQPLRGLCAARLHQPRSVMGSPGKPPRAELFTAGAGACFPLPLTGPYRDPRGPCGGAEGAWTVAPLTAMHLPQPPPRLRTLCFPRDLR